jgi:hypothetical protein
MVWHTPQNYNINYYSSQHFFDLGKIISENFNISENNIISVELAQGTRVFVLGSTSSWKDWRIISWAYQKWKAEIKVTR